MRASPTSSDPLGGKAPEKGMFEIDQTEQGHSRPGPSVLPTVNTIECLGDRALFPLRHAAQPQPPRDFPLNRFIESRLYDHDLRFDCCCNPVLKTGLECMRLKCG